MDTDREAFTAGLRALADFLDAHPDVPVPTFPDVTVHVPSREDVERVAADLRGWLHVNSDHGHFWTAARFGPIEYRVLWIDPAVSAVTA